MCVHNCKLYFLQINVPKTNNKQWNALLLSSKSIILNIEIFKYLKPTTKEMLSFCSHLLVILMLSLSFSRTVLSPAFHSERKGSNKTISKERVEVINYS